MKLVKEKEKFYIGMKNDYENHIYCNGTDIYGQKRSLGCNEISNIVYSRIDYEIDWR